MKKRGDALECPVDFFPGDNKRRRDTDDVVVCFFAENPKFLEGFAEGAGGFVEDEPNPESAAAYLLETGTANCSQSLHEVLAELIRPLDKVLFYEYLKRSPRCCRGEGISSECRTMVSGLKYAEDILAGEHRRHWIEPAGESLANDDRVGANVFVLKREQPSTAAKTRLDLIGDEQYVVLAANPCRLTEISFRWNDNTSFTLYRLDEKRRGVRRNLRPQIAGVAVSSDNKARSERSEIFAVLLLCRKANDGCCAAVEISIRANDLRPVFRDSLNQVTPLAGSFDGRLNCFRSGIHQKDGFVPRQVMELLIQQWELVVTKSPARQRKLHRLFQERFEDSRVAMSLVHSRVCRETVKITVSFNVGEPDTSPALEHNIEREIVPCSVLILKFDIFFCRYVRPSKLSSPQLTHYQRASSEAPS